MKWSVAQARQRLAELLQMSRSEPQAIYNRGRLVAAVCGAEIFKDFQSRADQDKRRTLGDAFKGLRDMTRQENYSLTLPKRRDRKNPLPDSLS